MDQVRLHLTLQCDSCGTRVFYLRHFLSWVGILPGKSKLGWAVEHLTFISKCWQLAIVWKVTLPNGFSSVSAHHGTLEVGAMELQTVKVHIKVCNLQGWPAIFLWTDMEPELYSVPALCLVQNELVLVVGLWLPNVCSSVKGPWWFSHDNLSSPWSISQDKCTLVPRVSFKGCLWLYIELYTQTLRGDSNTNATHSDQNMLVFILSSSSLPLFF